jgi:hypothetical protein
MCEGQRVAWFVDGFFQKPLAQNVEFAGKPLNSWRKR